MNRGAYRSSLVSLVTRLTTSIHSAPAGPVGDRWMEGDE